MIRNNIIILIIGLLVSVALIGCNNNPEENDELLLGIPYDAVKLEAVGNNCSAFNLREENCWLRWEYKGDCFMSRDIGAKRGLITRITCPDSIDRSKRIRNGKIVYVNQ